MAPFAALRPWLVWGSVLLGGVCLFAFARYASLALQPVPATEIRTEADCDLQQGPCSVALPGGARLSLTLDPRPVAPMQPFRVEVVVAGLEANEVAVDFQGADMDMGFNRFSLPAMGDGRFAASAILPVCARDRMAWVARVFTVTANGNYSTPFQFATTSP